MIVWFCPYFVSNLPFGGDFINSIIPTLILLSYYTLNETSCIQLCYWSTIHYPTSCTLYSHPSIYRASRGKRKMHGISRGTVYRGTHFLGPNFNQASLKSGSPVSTVAKHFNCGVQTIRDINCTILCLFYTTVAISHENWHEKSRYFVLNFQKQHFV